MVKRTDVVLDSADIKEDAGMKAAGGMEDRAFRHLSENQ